MTIDATAQALVANDAAPNPAPEPVSDDDGLAAIFDKIHSEQPGEEATETPVESDAPEQEEAPQQVEGVQEAIREGVEAEAANPAEATKDAEQVPSELPKAVRDHWKDIPEGARDGLVASQRDMSRKLANMTRQFNGIEPIRDVLVDAIKENPSLANLKPGEMAQEVMQTARIAAKFREKPVETLMAIAKENGVETQLSQALQGVQPSNEQVANTELIKELRNEIAGLKKAADPAQMRQTLNQHLSEQKAEDAVLEFASKADHWDVVEEYMPQLIPLAQARLPGASEKDVLKEAYDMGIAQFVPGAKAQAEPVAEKATDVADPERAKAAKRAISTNVKGSRSGQSKSLSEEDTLAMAYDRASRN